MLGIDCPDPHRCKQSTMIALNTMTAAGTKIALSTMKALVLTVFAWTYLQL